MIKISGWAFLIVQIALAFLAADHQYNTQEDWGSLAFTYFYAYSFGVIVYMFLTALLGVQYVDKDITANVFGQFLPMILAIAITIDGWLFINPSGNALTGIFWFDQFFDDLWWKNEGSGISTGELGRQIFELSGEWIDLRYLYIASPRTWMQHIFIGFQAILALHVFSITGRVGWLPGLLAVSDFIYLIGGSRVPIIWLIFLGVYSLYRFIRYRGQSKTSWITKDRAKFFGGTVLSAFAWGLTFISPFLIAGFFKFDPFKTCTVVYTIVVIVLVCKHGWSQRKSI